jgi:hypothetical protein
MDRKMIKDIKTAADLARATQELRALEAAVKPHSGVDDFASTTTSSAVVGLRKRKAVDVHWSIARIFVEDDGTFSPSAKAMFVEALLAVAEVDNSLVKEVMVCAMNENSVSRGLEFFLQCFTGDQKGSFQCFSFHEEKRIPRPRFDVRCEVRRSHENGAADVFLWMHNLQLISTILNHLMDQGVQNLIVRNLLPSIESTSFIESNDAFWDKLATSTSLQSLDLVLVFTMNHSQNWIDLFSALRNNTFLKEIHFPLYLPPMAEPLYRQQVPALIRESNLTRVRLSKRVIEEIDNSFILPVLKENTTILSIDNVPDECLQQVFLNKFYYENVVTKPIPLNLYPFLLKRFTQKPVLLFQILKQSNRVFE